VLFTLFVFAYVKWCPIHIALCFCFVCLRLVCRQFLWIVHFDCPFGILECLCNTILNHYS
jgi:hypothetical protein